MRYVKEKVAEQRLAQWAEAHGVLSVKLNIQGRRGWPDRVFFLPGGRPYLVEMKAEGAEPRKLQLHIHSLLLAQGYMVEVHDTAEEPIAFIKRHLSLWARFWAKVDKRGEDECWLWKAELMPNGYGRIGNGGRGAGASYAHRVAWSFFNGPIIDGLDIMHLCNTKACVNPKHLRPGSRAENMQMASKDGLLKGMRRGLSTNAKLTEQQAAKLRGPLGFGELSKLAAEFGISVTHASRVRHNKRWKSE